MPYLPIPEKKSPTFSDLKLGEKFFFYADLYAGSVETCVKVSDDSFIRSSNGKFDNLCILSTLERTDPGWHDPVESQGMMPEAEYEVLTASHR